MSRLCNSKYFRQIKAVNWYQTLLAAVLWFEICVFGKFDFRLFIEISCVFESYCARFLRVDLWKCFLADLRIYKYQMYFFPSVLSVFVH